jgi:hypothetical protein
MGFHEVPWNSMRFYDVLVNRSVPTEANRGLTSYNQLNYLGTDVSLLHLFGDNQPAIDLVFSEGHHERTKHVDIYYHYIKNAVKDGKIKPTHVPTAKMAADGLTKPLDKIKQAAWVAQVGLRKPLLLSN